MSIQALFGFIIFATIVGWFISAVIEQDYVTSHAAQLDIATGYSVISIKNIDTFSVLNPFSELWRELIPKMLTWKFAFLEGNAEWIRWFVLIPISAVFVFSVGILMAQMVRGFVTR